MDAAAVSGILDAVYESAVSAERWPDVLTRLADGFGCVCVALIDRDLQTMQGQVVSVGVDDGSRREFLEVWSERDVLRLRSKACWRPGAIDTDRDILPRFELLASDYYNGFMKPRDMYATMRVRLARQDRFAKSLSLMRPPSAGDFEVRDIEQCRLLVPHLQRAASINLHLDAARVSVETMSDVLQTSPSGIVVLDPEGRIRFANRSARTMAQTADSFLLRGDRIEIINREDDATLQILIAGATRRLDRPDAALGGVVRLRRKSGKAALTAAVSSLPARSSWAASGPAACIVITDPEAGSPRSDTMLKHLFDLSAMEIRVAERLLLGENAGQAAAALGIKISTLRWHLASLYRKTGTGRQAELVRLLLSLPAV